MARHRKHRRHRGRRRHRVGAINAKGLIMKAASVAAGAFVGRTLQNMAAKSLPSVSPKYVALGTVVLGALTPKFIKSDFGQGLGDGVLAIGVLSSLQQFGVITGIGAFPGGRVAPRVIRGYNPSANAVGSYNAGARAVGDFKPHMKSVVGMMPDAKSELMMGALLYDE